MMGHGNWGAYGMMGSGFGVGANFLAGYFN